MMPTFSFTLRLDEPETTTEEAAERLYGKANEDLRIQDILLATSEGVSTVDMSLQANDLQEAIKYGLKFVEDERYKVSLMRVDM